VTLSTPPRWDILEPVVVAPLKLFSNIVAKKIDLGAGARTLE